MSWEGKKVESYVKGLTIALETMTREIIKAIHDNDQSVEVIARELARRERINKDDPGCSSNAPP
jgi:hypothetical protein